MGSLSYMYTEARGNILALSFITRGSLVLIRCLVLDGILCI